MDKSTYIPALTQLHDEGGTAVRLELPEMYNRLIETHQRLQRAAMGKADNKPTIILRCIAYAFEGMRQEQRDLAQMALERKTAKP
jgi:hypothetical protein